MPLKRELHPHVTQSLPHHPLFMPEEPPSVREQIVIHLDIGKSPALLKMLRPHQRLICMSHPGSSSLTFCHMGNKRSNKRFHDTYKTQIKFHSDASHSNDSSHGPSLPPETHDAGCRNSRSGSWIPEDKWFYSQFLEKEFLKKEKLQVSESLLNIRSES